MFRYQAAFQQASPCSEGTVPVLEQRPQDTHTHTHTHTHREHTPHAPVGEGSAAIRSVCVLALWCYLWGVCALLCDGVMVHRLKGGEDEDEDAREEAVRPGYHGMFYRGLGFLCGAIFLVSVCFL